MAEAIPSISELCDLAVAEFAQHLQQRRDSMISRLDQHALSISNGKTNPSLQSPLVQLQGDFQSSLDV
jgi:hypothetical protein